MNWRLPIGATCEANGTTFRVWAPQARAVDLLIFQGETPTAHALSPMTDGYFQGTLAEIALGARYAYRIDGQGAFPDPASRFQPEGPHAPSMVVDPSIFRWSDRDWRGIGLDDLVIYELHVGTATSAGTFDALIERLDDLQSLGITAIELMPIADFPGERNWGYDGVSLFAPAHAYGDPEALRRLVDAAHRRGLAVILDVVYNHLGPDGNYLRAFSPYYFTARYQTPWGEAINVDGDHAAEVRAFFSANACYWISEYHLDGLRFDATHAIFDQSERHLLSEIAEQVRAVAGERQVVLIAEDERNQPQVVLPVAEGGWGLDAVWADDFHHQVRVALAGDRDGYYADYRGTVGDLVQTLQQGWFYTGQRSPHLGRARGASPLAVAPPHFIHCLQNHDQVGNRALGDRLNQQLSAAAYRAISALLLLSPYTPMLWMGQEWAASTPFQFFTDHQAELGWMVTEGRRREFASFAAFSGQEIPDPQDEATFQRSKLRWQERDEALHAGVLRLYSDLLALRRTHPALQRRDRAGFAVVALSETTLALVRYGMQPGDALLLLVGLRAPVSEMGDLPVALAAPSGWTWQPFLSSEESRYGGTGMRNGPLALLLELV